MAIPISSTETAAPLELTIEQEGVGGVTGLTGGSAPTVRLRRQETTGTYLDFADNTFKTSGWTTLAKPLVEVGSGHYQSTFDPSTTSPALAVGDYLVGEFTVSAGSVIGDDHDIYAVQDLDAAAIAIAVRDISIATTIAGSLGEGVLIARNGKVAYRLDTFVRNANGFAVSARLRIFPDQATAAASTSGGTGEGELVSVPIFGTPDGTFVTVPSDVVAG